MTRPLLDSPISPTLTPTALTTGNIYIGNILRESLHMDFSFFSPSRIAILLKARLLLASVLQFERIGSYISFAPSLLNFVLKTNKIFKASSTVFELLCKLGTLLVERIGGIGEAFWRRYITCRPGSSAGTNFNALIPNSFRGTTSTWGAWGLGHSRVKARLILLDFPAICLMATIVVRNI